MYSEVFQQMLDRLNDRVNTARRIGMSSAEMIELTKVLGDWLSHEADPNTVEQRLLKEMWTVADEEAKATLSRLLIEVAASQRAVPHPPGAGR